MNECYDRSNERRDFDDCESNVIFFTSANGNGMTTFLYNVLNSKQYIFIKESMDGEIIFDKLDRSSFNFEKTRRSFLNLQREELEDTKAFMSLLYLIPNLGSFFYSAGVNSVNYQIKKINSIEYSFTEFLKTYISIQKKETLNNEPIYLVVDHANRYSYSFICKLREQLNIENIKLVICLDEAIVKAEYKEILQGIDYKIIDFSKPKYTNALVIFQKSGMDQQYYNEKMYESSRNLIDFFGKYQVTLKKSQSDTNTTAILVYQYVHNLPCIYCKEVIYALCEYLVKNSYVNHSIDAHKIIDSFIKDRVISPQGMYFKTISPVSDSDIAPMAIGFASYVLCTYKNFNYDFLYYIFTQYKDCAFIDHSFLQYLLDNSSSPIEINEVINIFKKRKIDYPMYLTICKSIVDKMFYDCLFEYDGEIQDEWLLFDKLLRYIIRDRKHMLIDIRKFIRIIAKCMNRYDDPDVKCMFAIVYFDYCVNHARKYIKRFFKPHDLYYYRNFSASKIYYVLESIIAYYESDSHVALQMYDDAIKNADETEKIYFLNNKFAYVLSRYINYDNFANETEMVIKQYDLKNNCCIVNNEFLNTNIVLYESIKKQCSVYNTSVYWDKTNLSYQHNLKTWNLYKIINHHILRFAFDKKFTIGEFSELEGLILETNRAPAKNIYYYNLFLMALCFDNKMYLIKAKSFLDKNRDFRCSNLYDIYNIACHQHQSAIIENKRRYIRFGYIFSRMTSLTYLFDAMAVFIK